MARTKPSLDDLRDDTTPEALPPSAAVVAAQDDAVYRFEQQIRGMLVGDDYLYAEDTLRGILDTVTRTGRVSDNQRRAVQRIDDKPTQRRRRGR